MVTLSHVGIAVGKDSPLAGVLRLLGLSSTRATVPSEHLQVELVDVSAPLARIELLETDDPASTVGKFLSSHGPGIHHLCLGVPAGELSQLCAMLRANGHRVLFEVNRIGAEGTPVNFIHPKSTGGVLLELQEQPGHREP